MGLQQRPCLHQRSLLQRLLAADHSGQIRRFGRRPQCERLLRRIGFGRSVLPARILGRRPDMASGRRREDGDLHHQGEAGRGHLSRAGLRRTEIPRRRGMFVRLHVPRRSGYSPRQPLHPLAGLGQHPYHTEQHHHDGRRRFEPSGKDMVGFRSRVIEKQRIA